MTILFVTDSFAIWGGVERVLANKMNFLADRYGYDVHFVTTSQGQHAMPYFLSPKISHKDLDARFHTQYLYSGLMRWFKIVQIHIKFIREFRHYIRQIQPDLIVSAKFELVGDIIKSKGHIPLIVEVHTIFKHSLYEKPSFLRNIYNQYNRRNVFHAERIVTLTNADAEDWRTKSRHVSVIPNLVSLNSTSQYCSYSSKSVIFVGRFETQKDIGSLFAIWQIVHDKHPDWFLDLYGEGEQKNYYLVKAQSLQSNIRIHEPTSHIFDKYRESSILVLTSLYEPFGLVLPEAMSCGLPVVSFDCPYGPVDIITDGVDGFIIKNRDIENFAEHICMLMEDETLRRRMGQAAVKSSQRYSAEQIMPQWKELFEKVAGR